MSDSRPLSPFTFYFSLPSLNHREERAQGVRYSGDIVSDISLAAYPDHPQFPYPHSEKDACSLPPIKVSLAVGTGDARAKHSDWEEPCRQLSVYISTDVGDCRGKPCPRLIIYLVVFRLTLDFYFSRTSFVVHRTLSTRHRRG